MITYAQNFEDVMLARAFRGERCGFYIDVGAWHPVHESVTKHFYDLGWSGINIEPNPEYFQLLVQERPRDVNLPVALGDRNETRTLYRFEGSGLSTFSAEHLDEFRSLGLRDEPVEARVRTLREVCEEHVQGEIDFLKIDVEGWELPVIRGADWARFRPRIVLVEAVVPAPRAFLSPEGAGSPPEPSWEAWEGILLDSSYELCYFDGLNRFYVRREDYHLCELLQTPPNTYDTFVNYRLPLLETERDRAREELERVQGELAEAARRLDEGQAECDRAREEVERVQGELAEIARRLHEGQAEREALVLEREGLAEEVRQAAVSLARISAALDTLAGRCEELEGQLQRTAAESRAFEERCLRTQEELRQTHETLQQIIGSRSWRYTQILQGCAALVRRTLRIRES